MTAVSKYLQSPLTKSQAARRLVSTSMISKRIKYHNKGNYRIEMASKIDQRFKRFLKQTRQPANVNRTDHKSLTPGNQSQCIT